MKPIISVVTPCRNAAAHIEETMQSVLEQTLANVEHVIVDDGSTDESANLAEAFAAKHSARVRVIRQSAANGNVARNVGARAAKGDLLLFLDADDLLVPDALEKLAAQSSAHPGSLVMAGWDFLVHRKQSWVREDAGISFGETPPDWLADLATNRRYLVSGTMLWPRAVLDRIGGWDESLLAAQDKELFLRALGANAPMIHCEAVTLLYRRHSPDKPSLSSNFHDARLFASRVRVMDVLREAIRRAGREAELSKDLGRRYFQLAEQHQEADAELATQCLRRAVAMTGWAGLPEIALPHRVALDLLGYEGRNRIRRLVQMLGIRKVVSLPAMVLRRISA